MKSVCVSQHTPYLEMVRSACVKCEHCPVIIGTGGANLPPFPQGTTVSVLSTVCSRVKLPRHSPEVIRTLLAVPKLGIRFASLC